MWTGQRPRGGLTRGCRPRHRGWHWWRQRHGFRGWGVCRGSSAGRGLLGWRKRRRGRRRRCHRRRDGPKRRGRRWRLRRRNDLRGGPRRRRCRRCGRRGRRDLLWRSLLFRRVRCRVGDRRQGLAATLEDHRDRGRRLVFRQPLPLSCPQDDQGEQRHVQQDRPGDGPEIAPARGGARQAQGRRRSQGCHGWFRRTRGNRSCGDTMPSGTGKKGGEMLQRSNPEPTPAR